MKNNILIIALCIGFIVSLGSSDTVLAANKKLVKQKEVRKEHVLQTLRESKYGLDFELDVNNLKSIRSFVSFSEKFYGDGTGKHKELLLKFYQLSYIISKNFCDQQPSRVDRQECLEKRLNVILGDKIVDYVKTPPKILPSNIVKFKTTDVVLDTYSQRIDVFTSRGILQHDDNFPSSVKENWIKELSELTGYEIKEKWLKVVFVPTSTLWSDDVALSKIMRLQEAQKKGDVEARVTGIIWPMILEHYGNDESISIIFHVDPTKVDFFTKDGDKLITTVECIKTLKYIRK